MKRTLALAFTLASILGARAHAETAPPYTTHLPIVTTTSTPIHEREAVGRYLEHVYDDGDVLNDWLTHVRPSVADALQALGQAITATSKRFTFTVTFEGELTDQAEFLRGFTWARREGMSNYQSMWIGMGEVLDNHLEEEVMQAVWLVIEEQCVN